MTRPVRTISWATTSSTPIRAPLAAFQRQASSTVDSQGSLRPPGRSSRTERPPNLRAWSASTGPTPRRRARAPAGWDRLRRDGLRQERQHAGGVRRQRGWKRRPTELLQRGRRPDRSDLVSGPDPEPGWGLHEHRTPTPTRSRRTATSSPSVCRPQAAAQNFACDSSGNVTMGTAQGAEMAQFITFVACLGQSEDGAAGLFADSAEPGGGRLPGGGATAGRDDPARSQPAKLRRTRISPEHSNLSGVRPFVGSANPGGSDVGAAGRSGAAGSGPSTAAASHGAGGGGLVATQSVSGPGSSAAAAKGSAAALAKKKQQDALTDPEKAYARQDGLVAAAAHSPWSPTVVALWSVVFAVVLVGVPLAAWFWQRRRRDLWRHHVKVTRIRVLIRLAPPSQSARCASLAFTPGHGNASASTFRTGGERRSLRTRARRVLPRPTPARRSMTLPCAAGPCTVTAGPVSQLGQGQAVYVNITGLESGEQVALALCSLDVGNHTRSRIRTCASYLPAAPIARRPCSPTSSPLEWQYARHGPTGRADTVLSIGTEFDPDITDATPIVSQSVGQYGCGSTLVPSSVTTVRRIPAVSKSWTSG